MLLIVAREGIGSDDLEQHALIRAEPGIENRLFPGKLHRLYSR
jgi:hypothetical protein